MRFIKILFSICLLLVIVLVFALAAISYFADPNQLKPLIAKQIKKQTGSNLVIEGNFTWRFYPHFGVQIPHLTLSQEGQSKPYVDMKNVNIATSLAQLWKNKDTLKGNIYIEELTLMKIHVSNAKTKLHWQNQILTLQPLTANLYSGSLSGKVQIVPNNNTPAWNWDLKFDDLQVAPLLSDINGDSPLRLIGTLKLTTKGMTQGKSREQLLGNLNGNSQFEVRDGTISGVDLNYLVQTADAFMNKQPISLSGTNQTIFNSLTGTADIKAGVIISNDLVLTSPTFITAGNGSINLINQSIEMKLDVKPQQTLKSQWQVPVVVSGNLNSPQIGLDMSQLHKVVTDEQIDKAKAKVKDQIQKHIPGKAGEFLQNLLGG